ncbi:M12 family metallo-peptidase [Erwinia sp. 198]|uniref:M12 family metallo-peptidase n=1 Tax=Erwinia sp. 198 TaxID=2022746 RepID=UPI001315332E|nr:M12 family metallo-peptidase [Erwinia sp. 198]
MTLLKSTPVPHQDIDSVNLILPGGEHVAFQRWSEKKNDDGSLAWTGETSSSIKHRLSNGNPDPENTAILIIKNDKVYGSLTFKGETFQILPLAQEKESLVIVKVDQNKIPEEEKHDELFTTSEARATCPAPGNYVDPAPSEQVVIRVGLVTTNQSRAAFSSLDFDALAKLAFEKANQGNLNSNVRITFVNAGVLNLNYNEKATLGAMLSDMNGVLRNEILPFREQQGTDLVVMLAVGRNVNGVAYTNANRTTSLAVVNSLAFTEGNTFVHEMGHNIGLRHDLAQYGVKPSSPCYQHGYQHEGNISTTHPDRWRTIMAYNCSPTCWQINMFSNPRVIFRNVPAGTVQYEDSARRLNERREMVSRFYSNVTANAVVPNDFSIMSRSHTGVIYQLDGRSSTGYDPVWKVLSEGPMGLQEVPSGPVVREVRGAPMVRAAFPANSSGKAVYELSVRGYNGTLSKKTVSVTVTAPQAQIHGPASVRQGDSVTLTGQTNFTASRWQWSLKNGSQTIAQGSSSQFTLAPQSYAPGKYTVELEAVSADGMYTGTSTHALEVISSDPAVVPVAVVPNDFSVVSSSSTATIRELDGSRSIGKGFIWRAISDGPSGLQQVAGGPIVREVHQKVARAAFPRNASGQVTYELLATGTGGMVDSKTITVTVAAPHAQIQGPASVKHGNSVTLTGQTNFPVSHWQWSLKQGDKAIAQSDAREFSLETKSYAGGHYQIQLAAVSADGLRSALSTHALEIVAGTPPPPAYPAYVEGSAYKAGERVSAAGGIYACKAAPYTGWCAGAAWAYAPGTGLHWQQAWDKVE